MFSFLKKAGIEEITAFYMVETLRKGKKLKTEELKLLEDCNMNPEVKSNIKKIQYLFPESHAQSYGVQAIQIATYKLYYPAAFYPVLLSQYAKDVSDFNFEEVSACKNLAELKKIEKTYSVGQGQDVVIKCKTRLAWLIWEAKLRGYELKPATIFSLPDQFSISKDEPGVILMPLTSLTGVAENSAQKVYETIKTKPLTSYEDMLSRKDDLNRTIFNKKVLTGLGLNDFTIAMQQKFFMFLKRHNEQS